MSKAGNEFDAIIVGARVAGSAAAIHLGGQGRRVLLIDKASFPSETISTHIVSGGGVLALKRLGALDLLDKAGAYRFMHMRMQFDQHDMTGVPRDETRNPVLGLCLGRYRMDQVMLDCARSIESVSLLEQTRVLDLLVEDGHVVGITAVTGSEEPHEFRAPLTIGADGMHSVIARLGSERVGAFKGEDTTCARAYYYAYFEGVDPKQLDSVLLFKLKSNGEGYIGCRSEAGKTVVAIGFDKAELPEFKENIEAKFLERTNTRIPHIMKGARLSSRLFSVGNLLNTYRDPATDGALLLGDSGLHVDPLFGQGHSFALLSAEILGGVAREWFSSGNGKAIKTGLLSEFTRRRDALLMPHYYATVATSRAPAIDPMLLAGVHAGATEQWAADEIVTNAQFMTPPGKFPTFRLARLVGSLMKQPAAAT